MKLKNMHLENVGIFYFFSLTYDMLKISDFGAYYCHEKSNPFY